MSDFTILVKIVLNTLYNKEVITAVLKSFKQVEIVKKIPFFLFLFY